MEIVGIIHIGIIHIGIIIIIGIIQTGTILIGIEDHIGIIITIPITIPDIILGEIIDGIVQIIDNLFITTHQEEIIEHIILQETIETLIHNQEHQLQEFHQVGQIPQIDHLFLQDQVQQEVIQQGEVDRNEKNNLYY